MRFQPEKQPQTAVVCVLLEGCVGENRDSQEQGGDSAAQIGYNGQDLLIIRVHRSPGDILEKKAHLLGRLLCSLLPQLLFTNCICCADFLESAQKLLLTK